MGTVEGDEPFHHSIVFHRWQTRNILPGQDFGGRERQALIWLIFTWVYI
jgi:hypothetical protein